MQRINDAIELLSMYSTDDSQVNSARATVCKFLIERRTEVITEAKESLNVTPTILTLITEAATKQMPH